MEMTIDNTCEPKPMSKEEIVDTLKTMVFGVQAFERFNAKERETLDKAWNLIDQYEARLNADLVAILEDLDLQIDELSFSDEEPTNITQDYIDEVRSWEYGKKGCKKLIQQKINNLKAESEEMNEDVK